MLVLVSANPIKIIDVPSTEDDSASLLSLFIYFSSSRVTYLQESVQPFRRRPPGLASSAARLYRLQGLESLE